MITDTNRIENDVRAGLERDALVKHPELISVSADLIGTVVLQGAVATPIERRAAVSRAREVDGVFEVIDRLKVHPPVGPQRADDEIRSAALQRLAADPRIHPERIHVEVSRGRVKLDGYVRHASQRTHAEEDVASVEGVVELSNEIEIR